MFLIGCIIKYFKLKKKIEYTFHCKMGRRLFISDDDDAGDVVVVCRGVHVSQIEAARVHASSIGDARVSHVFLRDDVGVHFGGGGDGADPRFLDNNFLRKIFILKPHTFSKSKMKSNLSDARDVHYCGDDVPVVVVFLEKHLAIFLSF